MARHLMIGNDIADGYTNGVLADGAINIQKQTAAGTVSLTAGDTIDDASRIRVVQGNGVKNIVSPWIYGKDVIVWSGKSAAAQAAQVSTLTVAVVATAAGAHTLKVINLTNGASPSDMKSYEISVAASASVNSQAAAFSAALNANLPHWIKTVSVSSAVLTVTGYKKGEVKADGSIQGDVVAFSVADNMDGTNGTTLAFATTTAASRGYGDGFYVAQMEEELRGAQYGYYNRLAQPITPALTASTAMAYDMYTIVATKDGSSHSQINGVDNLIEITIAFAPTTSSITATLRADINPWMTSTPGTFAAVTI